MPYALLDDGFHSDPKLEAIGLAGKGLIANAFSYCGQWSSDGFVPLCVKY